MVQQHPARPFQNTSRPPQSGPRPGGVGARPFQSGSKPAYSGGAKPAGAARPGGARPAQPFDRRPQMTFVNEQIKAPNIMIIDENAVQLGVFPRRRALEIGEERGLDLVQVRYDQEQMISTVKLVDYGKYMYLKGKEDKEKKKTQKPNVMKELKLNYAIGDNDLQLKMKKAREMLGDGFHVRFFIKLKGREKIYYSKAIEKLAFIQQSLLTSGRPQFEYPKQEVQGYSIVLFSK